MLYNVVLHINPTTLVKLNEKIVKIYHTNFLTQLFFGVYLIRFLKSFRNSSHLWLIFMRSKMDQIDVFSYFDF